MDGASDDDELLDELAASAEQRDRLDELDGRVRQLAGVTAELAAKILADPPIGRAWNWVEFNQEQEAAAAAELQKWLGTHLVRFPKVFKHLRPCWAQHPEVVEHLSATYRTWRQAMAPKAGAETYAHWLDRWLPMLERIMRESLGTCAVALHNSTEIDLNKLG